MEMRDNRIDGGSPFDWGRVSDDYAEYRDIYPREFYSRIVERGLCASGQRILDVGTGTGVLPRNMHAYGGIWTGVDISEEQIAQARRLSIPFTRDSWHGRMKACRGVGASLPPGVLQSWEDEHRGLLQRIAPERFDVIHYAAVEELGLLTR